jgi:hypothetical protein
LSGPGHKHRDRYRSLLACRWQWQVGVDGWPEPRRRGVFTLLAGHDLDVTGHQPAAATEGVVDPRRQGGAGFSRIGFWQLVRDDRIHFELHQPLRIDES